MARPSSSVAALGTGTHRTKADLKRRKDAEKALATGQMLVERPEVARNPAAHAEFERLNGLLVTIGKCDAIYETVINRYCIIQAECLAFEDRRERIYDAGQKIEERLDAMGSEVDIDVIQKVTRDLNGLYKTMIELDKQVESKRKMLLSIEKENIMTVAAALRSVPKAPEPKENPLKKALG